MLKIPYPSLATVEPQVRLVHRGDRILPALQSRFNGLITYAEKTLASYGIEIIANRKLTRVRPNGAFLDDESFLPSRMVISTVGQRRIRLTGTESMARDVPQRLYTNAYQQVLGHANV